jgi:phosphohistidine phosphatase SixA
MKLILLRHALQEGSVGTTDPAPGLSIKGKKQQQCTNQYLQESGLRPSCIYTSPVRRAVETAKMGGAWFSCPVVLEEALGNSFDEDRLIQILLDEPHEIVCFIGHAPTLPDFAQKLVGDTPVPDIGRSCALILDLQMTDGQVHGQPFLYITPEGIDSSFGG